MKNLDWMSDALCAQTGPDLFFPETGQNVHKAKVVCGTCPVRTECGDHATHLEGNVSVTHRHGAWAGLSARQRAAQRRGKSPAAVRDAQIIRLTEQGMSLAEIADLVGCTDRTVARARAAHRQQEGAA